nr:hypothetical protein [Clostridia bacterium]
MIDLDITGADPKDVEEYAAINEEIDTLSPDDLARLKELLKRRAKVISRILGAKVFPVIDK